MSHSIKGIAAYFNTGAFTFFEEEAPGFINSVLDRFGSYCGELNAAAALVDQDADFPPFALCDDFAECVIEAFEERATEARIKRPRVAEIVKILELCTFTALSYESADNTLYAHVDMLMPSIHEELAERGVDFYTQPKTLYTYKH